MMFDPPDYPYKELTDTLREHYGPDDLLFEPASNSVSMDRDLVEVTEQIISSVESELSFSSNLMGRYFSVENTSLLDIGSTDQITELSVVQSDNLFNYESTLLDENTVNQFLLPLQVSSENDKDTENNGPDLLALHSCVVCHEIFTTDVDLLDHTISVHASDSVTGQNQSLLVGNIDETQVAEDPNNGGESFECEWLVCCLCERVLSTALETEPTEQLCCTDGNGKGSVASRKLHSMFVCDSCNYLFADGEALDRHKLTCFGHEENYTEQLADLNIESEEPQQAYKTYPCNRCNLQFVSLEELRAHTSDCARPVRRRAYTNSNSNKMWNCGSCNQLFATARELYRHKRGEDRPEGAPVLAYVCEECDKVLGSVCALHTHKKMHKITKPGYPCRVCGRRFNQSGHLAIHMRMHTGERPYPCDLCPKAFKVKVERDDHRRTHTGERPFACAACPKTFTAAARLREHARIHTDQRPYRCDICGAAFRRPYARTVHMLIHTGEKPHECDVCGTAFRCHLSAQE
ncbi:uncharacterized protein [Epargyreus clarus]|uniref:uncharacterized protein isoform X2 n=1 Tax=Epargyreus clarus TaxID=520877 RepID=UPI003C2C2C7B